MVERHKTLLAVLFAVFAFGLLAASVRRTTVADEAGAGLKPATEARRAPDFTLSDATTGRPVQLSRQTQPVLLDFWATWCGPCREELPHIEALSQKYAGRVSVYGINSSDSPEAIGDFARANGMTFPVLRDAQHEAARDYGADAIPLLVLIDRQGRVRYVADGYDPTANVEKSLSRMLDTLLAEKDS